MEARQEGKQPIAVTNQADTADQAVSGAIDKLKTSLETITGRERNIKAIGFRFFEIRPMSYCPINSFKRSSFF